MNALQAYIFRQILTPLFAILAALTAIAMLSQGLNQLDLIVKERGSGLAFLWVTLLAMPQLLALILPLALFFAVAYAINRLQSDSELVVAFAAGVSPWQIIAPVFRLAVLAALVQLVVGVLVQPAAYREMRETIFSIRGDIAASLVREGSFTTPADGLTIYAASTERGGELRNVMIHDSRDSDRPVTYTAKSGGAALVSGRPAMVMRDGQIQQPHADGSVDLLNFDQYVLELGTFMGEPDAMVLKPSDRFLSELFKPNLTNYYDQRNVARFQAEAHARMASPLLNMALAMIALSALLTGDFNRRGYGPRLARAAVLALALRLLMLAIQAGARETPVLNVLQYAIPIAATLFAILAISLSRRRPARRKRPPPEIEALPAGAAA